MEAQKKKKRLQKSRKVLRKRNIMKAQQMVTKAHKTVTKEQKFENVHMYFIFTFKTAKTAKVVRT